ncbi:hypothetical protein [Micromonospora sp. NPDC005171]|uniref:hypothetical protein n=1 Tax=Micromonospora sp. NPDC005171 TaxID=3156866 RepID=UPI0033BBC095
MLPRNAKILDQVRAEATSPLPTWRLGANPSGWSGYDGPVRGGGPPDHGDWVVLAEFHGGRQGGASIHWVIQRADLKERRFDQASVLVYWNP